MLNAPISIEDIDCIHPIVLPSSPQPSAPDNKATATNPVNQVPAGEVPTVTVPNEGDDEDSDGKPNIARKADGDIAEPDQSPLTNQPTGYVIMVKLTNYRAIDVVLRA